MDRLFGAALLAGAGWMFQDRYESSLQIPKELWKSPRGILQAIRIWKSKQNLLEYEWVLEIKHNAGGTFKTIAAYSLLQRICDAVLWNGLDPSMLQIAESLLENKFDVNKGKITLRANRKYPLPPLNTFLIISWNGSKNEIHNKISIAKLLIHHGACATALLKHDSSLTSWLTIKPYIAVFVIERQYLQYKQFRTKNL